MVISVVYVATGQLIEYERNPRRNDAVVGRMVESIREFGFVIPILATSDGCVIDGHLRLKAARKLGMRKVPVIWCNGWTKAQVKAFRLLANRSSAWAEWDMELVKLEISDLVGLDYDLSLTGFDSAELASLQIGLGTGLTDEDAVPQKPVAPVSHRGDLWHLGSHCHLCGDATAETDVLRLLQTARPMIMIVDPPWGVQYDPPWRNEAARAGKIAFAARREGKVPHDDRIDWSDAYRLFPGDVVYVWYASLFGKTVQESLELSGFELRSQIVWAKSRFAISRGHYHWQHQNCFFAVKKGANAHWMGDRRQTTLWQIDTVSGEEAKNDHGTPKPVECMRRPMLNHTKPGEAVYDPFVGSGATIIAAETIGRICYAIDIDCAYTDVAVKRWQDFTGRKAVLHGTNQTFDEVALLRTAGKARG